MLQRQRIKIKKKEKHLKREKRRLNKKRVDTSEPCTQTLNVQTGFSRSAWQPLGNAQQATTANRVLGRTEKPKTGFSKEAWQPDPHTAQRPQSVVQPNSGFNAEAWKPYD